MADFAEEKKIPNNRKYILRRRFTSIRRPQKLLVTYISYFLIVLLIPMIIGGAAYFKAGSLIGEEVQNSRIAMLNQVSQSIDFRLEEIQRIALQVATNYTVLDFLAAKDSGTESNIYKASRAINVLATMKNANTFIEDVFVYSKNMDLIISANSMYSTLFFYDRFYSYTQMDYQQWEDVVINDTHYNTYLPAANVVKENLQKKRLITYVQSIPITERNFPVGSVVILIDEEKIEALFEGLSMEGTAFILNQDGERIMETENPFHYYPNISMLGEAQDILFTTENDQKLVVMYTTSPGTGWKYVSMLSRDIFMMKANYIRNMTFVLVMAGLLLGVIVAFVLSKKVYSPIGFISDLLARRAGGRKVEKLNDFDSIKQSLVDTIAEYGTLERENKQNLDFRDKSAPYLVSNLLLKLVMNKGEDNSDLVSYLKSFDIIFPYDRFAILLYHIDDHSEFGRSYSTEKGDQVKTVLALVTEKMNSQGNVAYMAELTRNDYFLVVNLSSTIELKQVNEMLYKLAAESKPYIEAQCNTYLSVSISNAHLGIHHISDAYSEAQKAQDYRMVRGRGSIISFAEVEWHNENYYYPLELELQLINSVRSGNREKCEEILQSTYNENFQNRKLPLNLARCLFFDIMSTAIKLLDQYKIKFSQIFGDNYNPIDSITSCETVEEEFEQVRRVYNTICEYINNNKLSHNFILAKSIKDFIAEKYCDGNLSQIVIAEHFRITPTYLSKLFKHETGQNMVDYINEQRIDKAKRLLRETNDSLVRIAEKSGCTSDKMLIRIFKSYEGITPGMYRDIEGET